MASSRLAGSGQQVQTVGSKQWLSTIFAKLHGASTLHYKLRKEGSKVHSRFWIAWGYSNQQVLHYYVVGNKNKVIGPRLTNDHMFLSRSQVSSMMFGFHERRQILAKNHEQNPHAKVSSKPLIFSWLRCFPLLASRLCQFPPPTSQSLGSNHP